MKTINYIEVCDTTCVENTIYIVYTYIGQLSLVCRCYI